MRVLHGRVLGDMFGSYTHTKWIQYSTVDYVSSIWGRTKSYWWRIWPLRMLDRKWRHRKSHDLFPYFFPVVSRTFSCTFFSYFFSPYFISRTFSPVFPSYFFSVLFSRTFSKVATFEIQRLKISVSCFSSTCRYQTVHVPCEISIQTSPVGLPLDGWDSRMRDLKGPKMNLLKAKEDWNVL